MMVIKAPPLELVSVEDSEQILRDARTIGVLGIKPETRHDRAAHWVPLYLSQVGYRIVPIAVYYPEVHTILGAPVYRTVKAVPNPLDILNVFRKPADVPPHVNDILEARPATVWFQSGCLHEGAARQLTDRGIRVVHDCIACRRATLVPSIAPLWEPDRSE